MQLAEVTAIITGGAHRVGKALTLALAQSGCNLILHYNRSADEAEATASEARALGAKVILKRADLFDQAELARLVATVDDGLAPAQVLVNSAAIFPHDRLRDVTMESWSKTLRINLRAPVFLTQAFAQALPTDRRGAVVNITDWRTERPYEDHFSYTIAKGAIDTFTRAAALALAPQIRVNAIALGAMLPPPGKGDRYLQALAAALPLQRAGGTEVIAHTLRYLLENDFVTGEILRLDGGAHLQIGS